MSNRILNIFYFGLFIAVLLVMSWRDLHPAAPYVPPNAFPYYAAENATPELIPNDTMPISIAQGTFSYAKTGKTVWTPAGLKPMTLAQRQVTLQFRFMNLPETAAQTAETLAEISKMMDTWEHFGNNVAGLFIEYTREKPELKNYEALFQAVYDKFHLNYAVVQSINLAWLRTASAKELAPFSEDSSKQLLVVQPKNWNSPETAAALLSMKRNIFFIELPAGILVPDVSDATIRKISNSSFIITLDPKRPVPAQTSKVGLWPHF